MTEEELYKLKRAMRRGQLMRRMVKEILEYENRFDAPMPLKAISPRFNKPLMNLGGMFEAIDELVEWGELEVIETERGARFIQTTRPRTRKYQPDF